MCANGVGMACNFTDLKHKTKNDGTKNNRAT